MAKKNKFAPTMEYIPDTLIKDLKLTDAQVWEIVREWYTEGYTDRIFEDENGMDLEEIAEQAIQNITIGNAGLQRS